ncbi:MAG: hypothetical protein AAF412_08880 [Pseudomonadota bacterium]
MSVKIDKYAAKWDPNSKKGTIALFAKGYDRKEIHLTDASEFSAVLMVLSTSKTAQWLDDGSIASGQEDLDG